MEGLNQETDAILLVFGEIDCMEHIAKNAYRMEAEINDMVKDVAGRFVDFAKKINDDKFTVLIYGPSFSGYA